MLKRDYERYKAIADTAHPDHDDCHCIERVQAENAAALAWRLHHPIRRRFRDLQDRIRR